VRISAKFSLPQLGHLLVLVIYIPSPAGTRRPGKGTLTTLFRGRAYFLPFVGGPSGFAFRLLVQVDHGAIYVDFGLWIVTANGQESADGDGGQDD
jgi:hypothetical protein